MIHNSLTCESQLTYIHYNDDDDDLSSTIFKKEVAIVKNQEIRNAMKENNIKQWELAEMLGISENTMCRKLRKELPDEDKQRILEIIRGKEEGTNGRTL